MQFRRHTFHYPLRLTFYHTTNFPAASLKAFENMADEKGPDLGRYVVTILHNLSQL